MGDPYMRILFVVCATIVIALYMAAHAKHTPTCAERGGHVITQSVRWSSPIFSGWTELCVTADGRVLE